MARKKGSMFAVSSIHDEHKILMFAMGIAYGVGMTMGIFGQFWYDGLLAIAIGVVLFFIEQRERAARR